MENITVAQAAQELGIGQHSVFAYLRNGKLDGDVKTGQVNAKSLHDYQVKITPHHAEILQVLDSDTDLTERERDILERRARFEKLDKIGAAHGITKSRVSAIIKRVLARLAAHAESQKSLAGLL